MNTIGKNNVIEVITSTKSFRAVVEHATNGGSAALIRCNDGDLHFLYSLRKWDPQATGRWILDDGGHIANVGLGRWVPDNDRQTAIRLEQ